MIDLFMILNKVWYLAHPYKGDPLGNFESANKIGAELFANNIVFFSPISMSHPVNQHLPTTANDGWYGFDLVIAERWDGRILAENWDSSWGCRLEKKFFEDKGLPVLEIAEVRMLFKP